MTPREIWSLSLDGLRMHKLRFLLTLLGIFFGVASVVTMLAIAEGAQQEALAQIRRMGVRNFVIEAKSSEQQKSESESGEGPAVTKSVRLTTGFRLGDAAAIRSAIDNVQDYAPVKEVPLRVWYASSGAEAKVIGTSPSYASILDLTLLQGTFLRPLDQAGYARVCVISEDLRHKFFRYASPLGEQIRIADQWFTVIGVARTEMGDDPYKVYVDLSTALKRYGADDTKDPIDRFYFRVRDERLLRPTADLARRILKRLHNQVEDFAVVIPEELLAQKRKTQQIFSIVMGTSGGISLLVGGIGIMNIMLATILERTREIGIRRAVGARRRDIMRQFLYEALVTCLIGGVAGLIGGVAGAKLISVYSGWPTPVTLFSLVLAFLVSGATGVVFGYVPAREAASIDVVEALRYE